MPVITHHICLKPSEEATLKQLMPEYRGVVSNVIGSLLTHEAQRLGLPFKDSKKGKRGK
jgi:hypothetical protein